MTIGVGRFVRQVSGRGVYAVVRLEVSPSGPQLELVVESDPAVKDNTVAMQYVPAVTVGVRYAWEKTGPCRRKTGVLVKILEIGDLAVDTTEVAVVYAAALAMWDGLAVETPCPIVLVPESRSLQFPI